VYNFSCISVYKRPDDGWRLEPKRVTEVIYNTGVVCDIIRIILIV